MTRNLCALALVVASLPLTGMRPAKADDCDVQAASLAVQIGATVERRSEANIIFLKHPMVTDMTVGCPLTPSQHPDIGMSWDGAPPPAWFFDLAAHGASILSGANEATIRRDIIACWLAALHSKDELSDITKHGVTCQAQAFTRDGGGTVLTIFKANDE